MPLPPLLLTTLSVMSTVTAPFVESVFNPPPLLLVIVTRLNVAATLPPAAGLSNTPAVLFDIRLFVTTRLNGAFGSMSQWTERPTRFPEQFSGRSGPSIM
jgi:hypothetical protein